MIGEDEDSSLFRDAMAKQGIRRKNYADNRSNQNPLPSRLASKPSASKELRPTQLDQRDLPTKPLRVAVDKTCEGPMIEFARSGIKKRRFQHLKKGIIVPQESIDLHGLRSDQAGRVLDRFIEECRQLDFECVEIIHGKGRNSEQAGGVLKPLVMHWLKQQSEVMAFSSAPHNAGGSGATRVLLNFGD